VQFIDSLTDRNSGLGPAPGIIPRLQSIFGLFQVAGASATVSWGGQLIVAAIVAVGIWMIWARPVSFNLKAAALCAGTLLVVPYSILYDLTTLSISAVFLVKDGLSRGFLPGDRLAILGCWFFLLFIWFHCGPGPEVSIVLLLLVARRITSRTSQVLWQHPSIVAEYN
jgi:hypothetical protein